MDTVGMETGSRETSTPLQMVYNFWREFGLESLRPKLDELGLKIAEYQEESMQNRRRLSEVTREFRRKADDAVVRGVGDLLKQYQQEVDKLTKRAKHGETAFLDLYQRMYEAPDPTPAVSNALESASRILQLEAEVRQTAHELSEYQAESKELKNQELTIRRLEEKIRTLESQLGDKIKELENARREANAGAEAEMRDREARLATQLEESQASLEAMRKLHLASQNQVFSIQSQTEEERAGYRAELDLAASEMERMQARALALESEMQYLVTELDGAKSSKEALATVREVSGTGMEGNPIFLVEQQQLELNQQRQQLSQLKAELDGSQTQMEDYKQSTAGRLKGLKDALEAKDQYAKSLESELATRPTAQQVDDLTQQIQLLQAVQYSSEVDTADGEDGVRNSTSALGAGSLERVLLQKSRHLEHELTKAKLSHADLEQHLSSSETTIANLHRELDENRALVARLEEDLLAQSSQVPDDRKPIHGGGGSLPGFGQAEGMEGAEGNQTMTSVLCNQRDRFRRRVQEMEEQVGQLQAEISSSRVELKSARADNIALIERLKFMQGYRSQNSQHADLEVGLDVEHKYVKEYEEKMNPFNAFRGQQRDIRRKQLGFVDRAVYFVGELVFGNKYARLFVFCYVVVLHILVLATLLHSSPQTDDFLKEEEIEKLCRGHVVKYGPIVTSAE